MASSLEPPIVYGPVEKGMEEDAERLFDSNDENIVVTQLRRHSPEEPPHLLLGLPLLRQRFSELWLDSASKVLPEEMQQLRWIWVSEVARDVFLSSYGIMVQHVPLLGTANLDMGDVTMRSEASERPASPAARRSRQSAPPSPAGASPKAVGASEVPDAAVERLRLLATFLEPGPPAATGQSKVLAYWPEERGVDTQCYVSSVAMAADDMFREARQRLSRMEARRKAQADKLKRPAFMRQSLRGLATADEAPGQDAAGLLRTWPTPAAHAMSSQLAMPESSQTQAPPGPSVTMSQPVAGLFGDRKKKMKREKRKSGFR